MTPEELSKISQVLEVDSAALIAEVGPHWFPQRGLGPSIPTDPVLYRLYEVGALKHHSVCSWLEIDARLFLGCLGIRTGHQSCNPREVWGWYHVYDRL